MPKFAFVNRKPGIAPPPGGDDAMKKKDNREINDGDVVFLGEAPDTRKKRRRNAIVAAACAVAVIAVGSFFLGRTSKVKFNPDLTVLPKKVVEKMVTPMLDSLVYENFNVTTTQKATIYEPVAKQVPVRITNCTVSGDNVTYRFESTESHGDYGTISGEMTVSGNPVQWQGCSGFLADIQGTASIGSGTVTKGSSSVKRLAEDIMKKIPIDGDEVALPSGKLAYASIGRDSSGEYFIVSSKSPTTFDALSDVLLTAGAKYAIFVNGHLAYNWHIGDSGIEIDFASYTDDKPKELSLKLW